MNASKDDLAGFYEGALKIAERKMAEGVAFLQAHPPKRALLPRIATGGSFSGVFFWDSAFCALWAKYEPERFPVLSTLDNFYALQEPDGYICREFSGDAVPVWSKIHPVAFNPPIMAWAELELFQHGVSPLERLKRVYPHLKKHHEFCWKAYRRDDGLFFGDALGCGMDDLPRTPKAEGFSREGGIPFKREYCITEFGEAVAANPLYSWNRQMGWIDFSAQMAFNALNLSKMARALGFREDERSFLAQHSEMKRVVNEKCWDEERGFYFDCFEDSVVPRYHAGSFWCMLAEIIPPERASRYADVLKDRKIFNRPIPFPTLGANEPEYDPENGYWLGSVWPPTNYVALRGLPLIGEADFARDCAERYCDACVSLFKTTGTVWENISPEQSERPKRRAMRDFCGWGALAPVALGREFFHASGRV